jgi:hypothetical protein
VTVARLSSGIVFLATASLAVLAGIGCYNPKIKPGGLMCNKLYDQECPEGFYCDGTFCQKGPRTDAAVDRPTDVKTEMPIEKAPDVLPDMAVDTGPCLSPVAGCTPDMTGGKKCDPLCQTGCGCREKCSVNTPGALTCNVPSGTRVAKVGASCDFFLDGSAQQSDNCEPGAVCLHESCGDLCARFCRTDADCPGSLCARAIAGGFKVCDVAASDCNPIRGAGPFNCPGMNQACYLSSTTTDRTVCDCPFDGQLEGASCAVSRDCFGGLVCVDPAGGADLRCRRVCSLTGVPGGACTSGTCRPMRDSKKFGFCL